MTTKHTPGPWRFVRADDGFMYVVGPDGTQALCQIAMAEGVFANARLMASAPDLLAACEAVDRWATGLTIQGDVVPVVEAARAAIAKARGGA